MTQLKNHVLSRRILQHYDGHEVITKNTIGARDPRTANGVPFVCVNVYYMFCGIRRKKTYKFDMVFKYNASSYRPSWEPPTNQINELLQVLTEVAEVHTRKYLQSDRSCCGTQLLISNE